MQQIIAKNTKTFFTSWHLGFNSAIKQSKSLLEIAKKAVEMAIEDNEEKATNWIDQCCCISTTETRLNTAIIFIMHKPFEMFLNLKDHQEWLLGRDSNPRPIG